MQIEVSNGEIVDKQTILLIKQNKVTDKEKLHNISNELAILDEAIKLIDVELDHYADLFNINLELWEVEDELRLCEKQQKFDDHFITLARLVYQLNDERAAIKKQINLSTGSNLVEEKSY